MEPGEVGAGVCGHCRGSGPGTGPAAELLPLQKTGASLAPTPRSSGIIANHRREEKTRRERLIITHADSAHGGRKKEKKQEQMLDEAKQNNKTPLTNLHRRDNTRLL